MTSFGVSVGALHEKEGTKNIVFNIILKELIGEGD